MVTPAQTLTDLYAAQTAPLRSERFIDDPVTRRHDPSCPLSAFNLRFRYAVFGAYVSHDLLKVPGVRRCGHGRSNASRIKTACCWGTIAFLMASVAPNPRVYPSSTPRKRVSVFCQSASCERGLMTLPIRPTFLLRDFSHDCLFHSVWGACANQLILCRLCLAPTHAAGRLAAAKV